MDAADDVVKTPDGVPNFRDLGGLPVRGGGRIRHGSLFRAEAPGGLTPAGRAAVARIGLRLVCDLRGPQERQDAPGAWSGAPAPRLLVHAVGTEDPAAAAPLARLREEEDGTGAAARAYMLAAYAQLPAVLPAVLAPFVDGLIEGEVPALINCAAGKDRTGVAVALVLSALDVPRHAIERDYLASNRWFDVDRIGATIEAQQGWAASPATAAAIACRPEYLASAFAAVEHGDGSIDAYLERRLGLGGARREALRATLVTGQADVSS